MESDLHPSYGSLLRSFRIAHGLSQEALSEGAGVSREAISLLERGLRLSPRRDTESLLANTLKLSPDDRAHLFAAAAKRHGRTAIRVDAGLRSSLPIRLTSFVGREHLLGPCARVAEARLSALPVEPIARHLSDRLRLLTTGSRTALPRHQTLRALIDWSYDLLTASERTFLNRLSVFAGDFPLDAAEVVCEAQSPVAQSLVLFGRSGSDGYGTRPPRPGRDHAPLRG